MVKDEISSSEKQLFLQLIREGHNRAGAARRVNPNYTGTRFARLTSQKSMSYDHDFAIAYEQALSERPPGKRIGPRSTRDKSRPYTMHGYKRHMHIDDTELHKFITLVREGIPLRDAAVAINSSLYQLNIRCENDPGFAADYAEARRVGYSVMQENLRAETYRQAFNGDYRALKDLNLIHLPEFQVLLNKTKNDLDGMNLRELITSKMGELPAAVMDAIIQALETAEDRRELDPGASGEAHQAA